MSTAKQPTKAKQSSPYLLGSQSRGGANEKKKLTTLLSQLKLGKKHQEQGQYLHASAIETDPILSEDDDAEYYDMEESSDLAESTLIECHQQQQRSSTKKTKFRLPFKKLLLIRKETLPAKKEDDALFADDGSCEPIIPMTWSSFTTSSDRSAFDPVSTGGAATPQEGSVEVYPSQDAVDGSAYDKNDISRQRHLRRAHQLGQDVAEEETAASSVEQADIDSEEEQSSLDRTIPAIYPASSFDDRASASWKFPSTCSMWQAMDDHLDALMEELDEEEEEEKSRQVCDGDDDQSEEDVSIVSASYNAQASSSIGRGDSASSSWWSQFTTCAAAGGCTSNAMDAPADEHRPRFPLDPEIMMASSIQGSDSGDITNNVARRSRGVYGGGCAGAGGGDPFLYTIV